MNERIEKIKEHIHRHKVAYSCGATAVVVAGITCVVMRGRYEALANGGAYGPKTIDTSVTVRPLSILSRQETAVSVISRNGRGHPGYIIRCVETGEYFSSQRITALLKNISETILSKHLNGILEDAEGLHFERVALGD